MSPNTELKKQLTILRNNVVKSYLAKDGRLDPKNNDKIFDDESFDSLEKRFSPFPFRKKTEGIVNEPRTSQRNRTELFYIPFIISLLAFLVIPPVRIAPVNSFIENVTNWNLLEIIHFNYQNIFIFNRFNNHFISFLSLEVHLPLLIAQVSGSAVLFYFLYSLSKLQKRL